MERLKLVTSFDEMKPGVVVVIKGCQVCDRAQHRAMVSGFCGSATMIPPSHSSDGDNSYISPAAIRAGIVFRVEDGMRKAIALVRPA